MKRCGEFLTTLTDSREGKPGSVLSQAIKYCRNLETLVTCVTTKAEDKQLNQLLALSKKLKVLELNISFKNFKVFSHTLPTESLEELGMTSSNMIPPSLMLMCQKEILRKCHSLKQLDFNSIDDELVQLIGTKIQLEGLRLSTIHANHLTQTGLTPILNLRNLRVLYIISPEMPRRTRVHPPVNDDFLTALAENLRLLESLTFEAPARITDEGFAKLASLPNLKKLSIIYCQGVTDKYMVLFHKLEIFALIDCNVRDEGAIKFLEKSQNVKQLNLEGTHITNKTLVAAVQATKKRTNGIRLDLFNTDTNTVEWALTERSPLLQIVNQYHRKVIRINSKQTIYLPIQISN
ncbi:uncharacterized protein LOC107041708 isoform X3 [Diachasma alloeum]|uniref:uncharacterized protein LOC107041708 isoform X3 n=1 Tax=Diachasma alloeum TaxID=454923 RepID=UPI0007382CD8|nr:uncharacterized protein LOC107041708 isoform X3 [Diachasma alloeum]XP_015117881.1 uncharacterized protein LOC107041708 isoform X3 [Diachasma alloeum]